LAKKKWLGKYVVSNFCDGDEKRWEMSKQCIENERRIILRELKDINQRKTRQSERT